MMVSFAEKKAVLAIASIFYSIKKLGLQPGFFRKTSIDT
jgi:hypothetical protein